MALRVRVSLPKQGVDDSSATPAKVHPSKWHWKPWHLMASVALTAAAMTLDHYSSGTLYCWAILVVILAPMFLSTVDRSGNGATS